MKLDNGGISLTLVDQTVLIVLIQQGSNLPFMLTHKALNSGNAKTKTKHT